ncbi:MAG: oligosaccharide repeat unit polymerase, partial [Cyanobacteria bacterium J06639_18]
MISEHIYILISIAVLVISYLLFSQVAGSMSLQKINMISWVFFYQLFLHCFIGSILVVYNIDNHYLIHYIVNEKVRIYGWLAVLYTMIAMPIGMLIAKKIFNITSIKFLLKRYIKSPISNYISVKDNYIRILLYILSGFSFLVVIYTIITVGGLGLQSILYSVEPEALARQRIEAGREFGGNIYLRNIFGITLTPILAYIAYGYWKITKSSNDLIWFLFLLLLSLIITTYNLEKSPIFTFLIGFSLIN